MKFLKFIPALYLGLGIILLPAYSGLAIAQKSELRPLTIDSKKVVGKILLSKEFLKSKSDKRLASRLIKNAENIHGVGLYRSQLTNRTIAKKYQQQLSPKGARCLQKLKRQVVTLPNGSDAFRCDKNTFLLTLNGPIDASGVGSAKGTDGQEPTAKILDIAIVVITVVSIAVIMSSENDKEIKKGSLAEAIYCSVEDCPGEEGDEGEGVMAGPCGPNQSPGHDGLCGDLH